MGVPGFFIWLLRNCNNFVFQKNKIENIDILNEINSIDYFLIDTNCLIHPVCFQTLKDNTNITNINILETKMINNVIHYLNKLIDYVNPKKGIYLAIDGVAPNAKIKQQRTRRYKSISDKNVWDSIKKKHNIPLDNNYWNNSAITPGTQFMKKLDLKLIEWAKKQDKEIIYSGWMTPAEGEHKLLQFIRNNQNNNIDYIYTIYGLDADLIFLALSTNYNNIYLLREANEINNKESNEILNFVSIKIMKNEIINKISSYLNNDIELNCINDFIFMCYLLGNDFLPHILSLNIYKNGIENLIKNYIKTINEIDTKYLLDENNKINIDFLKLFITNLAEQEHKTLQEYNLNKNKRIFYQGSAYDREKTKIENLGFKIDDPIKLGLDNYENYRKRYYKYYWNVNDDNIEDFSKNLVEHYLTGLKWVTQYYFDKCPSWEWYYPYDHPPFLLDIVKYFINLNKIKFKIGQPLKPHMQLLAVLPPQSHYLLPKCLHNISSQNNLYPYKFEQDFLNKTKYWMGIPKLPLLDINEIKNIYEKNYMNFTDDEKKMNIFKKIKIYNN
jgi:5'-3' exonuclease